LKIDPAAVIEPFKAIDEGAALQGDQAIVFFNQRIGIEVGDGTDPVVFTGDATAQTLQTLLEACDDLAGYTVSVYGETQAADGLYTGTLIAVLPYLAQAQPQLMQPISPTEPTTACRNTPTAVRGIYTAAPIPIAEN